LHIWEVAILENTLGKLPLGKKPMGKYLKVDGLFNNIFILFRIIGISFFCVYLRQYIILIIVTGESLNIFFTHGFQRSS